MALKKRKNKVVSIDVAAKEAYAAEQAANSPVGKMFSRNPFLDLLNHEHADRWGARQAQKEKEEAEHIARSKSGPTLKQLIETKLLEREVTEMNLDERSGTILLDPELHAEGANALDEHYKAVSEYNPLLSATQATFSEKALEADVKSLSWWSKVLSILSSLWIFT